jgi:hypothetical protein
VNKKSTKKLRLALDNAITSYVQKFEFAHGVNFEYAVNDDLMGVLVFGDYYFSAADIVYDVDNKLPVRLIFQWQDDSSHDYIKGKQQYINLQSYAKGLRHEGVN